jgi:hypothetical protein
MAVVEDRPLAAVVTVVVLVTVVPLISVVVTVELPSALNTVAVVRV